MPTRKSSKTSNGRWVTIGGRRLFIEGGSERSTKLKSSSMKPTSKAGAKRKSGKTGKNAPVAKDNKWRSGTTGKATVKTPKKATKKKGK